MLRISPAAGQVPEWLVAVGGSAIGLVLLRVLRSTVIRLAASALALPSPLVALLVGALLRITWVIIFPSTPQSDGGTYLQLAQQLAAGRSYETAGTLAYWPVGYPLWLAGWLLVFDATAAVLFSQLAAYLIGAMGIYSIARQIRGENAARIAVWSFALWPNLLAQLATPEKESVVIAFLPWVMLLVFSKVRPWFAFAAGLLLGASILIQPSLQLLLPLLILVLWLRLPRVKIVVPALLVVLGTVLVVLPWTLRNYEVLGVPVLVSTNGGDNFYRANNPLATGGYTDSGERDLSNLSEIDRDRVGKQLAIKWIRENPADFLLLTYEKQLRYMGDDSATIYASLKRGGGTENMLIYGLAKVLANLWWLVVWMLLAIAAKLERETALNDAGQRDRVWLVWAWFYLFLLHSVFESASKYHLPMTWVLCVMLGCLLPQIQLRNEK